MRKFGLLLLALLSAKTFALEMNDEYGYIGVNTWYGQSTFSTANNAIWRLMPTIYYEGRDGFIDDNLINYYVLPYVGLTGQWRFAEVGGIHASAPHGIDDRNGNLDFGFTLGDQNLRLTYLYDVMSVHSGHELQAHVSHSIGNVFRRFELTPFIEFSWQDKNLSGHLYNVSAAEAAASGLDQYTSGATYVYKAGLTGRYDMSRKVIMVSRLQFEGHDYDSPLVQRNYGWSFEVGFSYQFAGY